MTLATLVQSEVCWHRPISVMLCAAVLFEMVLESYVAIFRKNRYLANLYRNLTESDDQTYCRLIGAGGEIHLTRRDVAQAAGGYGKAYREADLRQNDLVLIFLKHVPDLYGSFFGAMLSGVIPSFMPCVSARQDPKLYWSSHAELLRRIRPAAIVAARDTFADMQASGLLFDDTALIETESVAPADLALVVRDEDNIALLQHSSGTTGLKKGVALSFRAVADQIERYAAALEISETDRIVHWLPLYHDMGLIACAVLPAYLGVPTVHIDPLHWVSQPGLLLEAIAKHRGTLTWMPNFAFEHLVNICGSAAASYDLSSMRAFINCSETCKPRAFHRFEDTFAPSGVAPRQLHCCYAMAETVFAVSQTPLVRPPERIRVESSSLERGETIRRIDNGGIELLETGTPIRDMEVSILDEKAMPLPEDTVGEVALSAPFVFSGYYKDPERTAKRLRDGVYRTGDLGFVHNEKLYVLGRTDDLIIVNGRNIYAHQVEAAISEVEGLKPGRSVAVPVFDERVGSEVLIVMAERRRESERLDSAIQADVLRIVQSVFNVLPRKVRIVDEGWLIKTTSGKISRTENLKKFRSETKGVPA
ncbi:hypothetical protein CWB41_07230 [Methylovirgula ligni]|nr:AMP-binding protein [Methylovirgula ligni]QAY95554.1 hypothetical protein CWB41_07230 [Methylovirgula ligni]